MRSITIKGIQIKPELIVLGIIAIVLMAVRLTFLHEPFERDEGFYATIAQEILRGGVPYRDAIDMKPPGVFYLYALAISLFGATTESIRIFTALYSLGTLSVVYCLTSRLSGTRAGLFAAALFALYSGAPLVQGSSSNSEVFMVLPLVLSIYFFVVWLDEGARRFLGISALLAGCALLIKTVALPYVALLLLFSLLRKPTGNRLKEALLNSLAFGIPLVLTAIVTLLYFYLKGALHEFLAWNVTIPYFYAKGGGVSGPGLIRALRLLAPELLLPALVAVPTAIWLLFIRRDMKGVFIALLLPTSCLGVALPGKFFPHYFIQLFPFLSVLGGIGLAWVFQTKTVIHYFAGIIVTAAFAYYPVKEYDFFFVNTPEQVSVMKYGPTFADSVHIAEYIKKNSSPEDYIFQWGFEPELYFLADRRPPVPYIASTVLSGFKDPWPAVQFMMDNLRTKMPKYIVVQPEWMEFPGVDELYAFTQAHYVMEAKFGYALIFRRAS